MSSVPPSSIGLYKDQPGRIKGSKAQASETRMVGSNAEEVADVIGKSFKMIGFDFESRNDKKGLYTGRGVWQAPGQTTKCTTPYTFAAYIRQIDSKPTTKLTVLIDRYNSCYSVMNPEKILLNQVMENFTKILTKS